MPEFTRADLFRRLVEITEIGWVENSRPGNPGGVGNTLEDLLGIRENNLRTRDAGEFEIKSQRMNGGALTTLLHIEPSPRRARIVPRMLLPLYGWRHAAAGARYPDTEMSFRQTINGQTRTSRGFGIELDERSRRIRISFDARSVSADNRGWLRDVERRAGLGELEPQPYWEFDEIERRLHRKLGNCVYMKARSTKQQGVESFNYTGFEVYENFRFSRFVDGIRAGVILVDFDARTGHNHGTKFRMRHNTLARLYETVTPIGAE